MGRFFFIQSLLNIGLTMDELIVEKSQQHAPEMPDSYHEHTLELMKHMIALALQKKEANDESQF